MKKLIAILAVLMVCIFLFIGCKTTPASSTAPTSTAATSATTAKPATTTPSTVGPTSTAATATTTAKPATTTSATSLDVLVCPQGAPTPGLTPQYGGTLKILYSMAITNLGAPWKAMAGADRGVNRFCLENLVGLDEQGNPAPQLATSWASDPAAKTIIFTLRQGVKFQDGTDFNAAAVKWCLDKFRTGVQTALKAVTSVDVIDDNHVKLSLSDWDPLFIQNLSWSCAGKMVSPTAAQKNGDDAIRNPVGTGPFKFVSWQTNVGVKWARWEGYWQKGLPYLDAVEITQNADTVAASLSYTKGEANFITSLGPVDATPLKAKGHTITTSIRGLSGIVGDSKNMSSPYSDIKIRQAVSYAIDSNTMINAIFQGLATVTNQFALPGKSAFDTTIKGYPYNPAKAQELLAAAGYTTAKPFNTKITYTQSPTTADVYVQYQSYLKAVGINANLEPIDTAAYTKIRASGWTNCLVEFSPVYNGLEIPYSTTLSQCLSPDAVQYPSIWMPDNFAALYRTMLTENDMAKRQALYQQLNKLATDTYCLGTIVYASQGWSAAYPNVHDLGLQNITSGEHLPERIWISK